MYYIGALFFILMNLQVHAATCGDSMNGSQKKLLEFLGRSAERPPENDLKFFTDPKPMFVIGHFGLWKDKLAAKLGIDSKQIQARFKHVRDIREYLTHSPTSEDEIRILIVRMSPGIYYLPILSYDPKYGSVEIVRTDAKNWIQNTILTVNASGWKIFPSEETRGQVLGMLRLRVPGLPKLEK